MSNELFLKAIIDNKPEMVATLLEENPELVEIQDENGATGLMHAVCLEHEALVSILLDKGANAACQDREGHDLLWCFREIDTKKSIRFLIMQALANENGLPIEEDFTEKELLMVFNHSAYEQFLWCKEHDLSIGNTLTEWIEVLDEYYFDKALMAIDKIDNIDYLEYLLTFCKVNRGYYLSYNHYGATVLHLAVFANNIKLVKLLLEIGRDINGFDKEGRTPLFYLSQNSFPMLDFLLSQGADATFLDKNKRMAYHSLSITNSNLLIDNLRRYTAEYILQKQNKAQEKFFNVHRSHNGTTKQLLSAFLWNRTCSAKNTVKVCAEEIPARRLITADAGAVGTQLEKLTLATQKQIVSREEIINKLHFNNAGGMNWNREKVVKSQVEINYQYSPSAGNLGNFMMNGLGEYGLGKDNAILELINTLTAGEKQKEMTLATLILDSGKRGKSISEITLKQMGFSLSTKKAQNKVRVERLNRLVYLVSVKEISRRMNQGVNPRKLTSIEDLPFALAYYRGLRLVAEGHLSMKDIFDKDAKYGPQTGESITNERNLFFTKNKFYALNELFIQYNGQPKTRVKTEDFHQELIAACDGASDTSGDEYSSDEEIHSKLKVTPR